MVWCGRHGALFCGDQSSPPSLASLASLVSLVRGAILYCSKGPKGKKVCVCVCVCAYHGAERRVPWCGGGRRNGGSRFQGVKVSSQQVAAAASSAKRRSW